MRNRALFLAAVLWTTAACGGGSDAAPLGPGGNYPGGGNTGGTGGTGSTSNSINVVDNAYTPATTTVTVGTTVTWTWAGGYSAHSVTFATGASAPEQVTGSFSRQFPTAGSFSYHCTVHPTMNGTIIVQ